jgi:hypothetical protein
MVDETLKLSNDLTYRYYRPQMAGSDGASDSSAALHAALRERGYSTLGSRHAVLARLPQRTLACLDATMSAATMSASTTSAATTAAEALPLAKCYINLATRPDRRRDMEQAMQIAGLIGVQRIEAVTGDAVSDSLVGLYWNTALNAKFDRNCEVESALAMSSGERGCAASHAAAWARCVASGSPLLVMEDDVKFADGIDVGDTVRALVAAIEVGLAAHERTLLLYLGADAYIREGAPSLRGKRPYGPLEARLIQSHSRRQSGRGRHMHTLCGQPPRACCSTPGRSTHRSTCGSQDSSMNAVSSVSWRNRCSRLSTTLTRVATSSTLRSQTDQILESTTGSGTRDADLK